MAIAMFWRRPTRTLILRILFGVVLLASWELCADRLIRSFWIRLDALTRSQLQGHLLQLWEEARRTVLFVTHDLREAIVLADRVIVMTARPGTVKSDLRVDIPRPRDVFRVHEEPTFKPIHDRLWNEVVAELAQPPGVRTGPRR